MEWLSTIPVATVVVCLFGYLSQRQNIRYAKWLHGHGYKDAEYRVSLMKGRGPLPHREDEEQGEDG